MRNGGRRLIYTPRILGTCGYLGGLHSVQEEFCWSWSQMIQHNYEYVCQPGEMIYYDRSKISYHDWSRNYLAKEMRGDWLFQTDTDHLFEPDILVRLLRVMDQLDAKVVTAVYLHRAEPYTPVMYQFNEDLNKVIPIISWDQRAKVIPIDCAGAGALLVKREVFERIRKEFKEEPFDFSPPFKEDFSFFRRVKLLGIQTYLVPAVESFHLKTKPLGLADYNPAEIPQIDGPTVQGYM